MRIDKFLKVSRVIKRRSAARDACDASRIVINGKSVKPAKEVKVGDVVEVAFGGGTLKFEVLEVKDTVRKEDAGPQSLLQASPRRRCRPRQVGR